MKTEIVKSRRIEELHTLKNKIGDMGQIEIAVSFTSGGMNYFSGTSHSKGYRLHATPCQVTESVNGFRSRQSVLLSGKRDSGLAYRIEDTTRYSEKRLKELASQIDSKKIAEFYEEENDKAIVDYLLAPIGEKTYITKSTEEEMKKTLTPTPPVIELNEDRKIQQGELEANIRAL